MRVARDYTLFATNTTFSRVSDRSERGRQPSSEHSTAAGRTFGRHANCNLRYISNVCCRWQRSARATYSTPLQQLVMLVKGVHNTETAYESHS